MRWITTSVDDGPARTRALGYYGATGSIGFVAGLVLGGILVQLFDWRAVLWVNVPIGLLAAMMAPRLIPATLAPASRPPRLDITGAVLVTAGIGAAVYGISEAPHNGWLSWPTIAALLGALASVAAFVAVEQHQSAPLVRPGILRQRSLRVANLYTVMIGAWSAGELFVLPLYMQLVLHYSPVMTGLAMAPQGIVGFLGASRGAAMVQRAGLKRLLIASGVSAASGLLLLALMLEWRSYPLIVIGLILAGYGTATSSFGTAVAATQGIADTEQGLAGGLINTSRQVGAALGVAVVAAAIGTGATSGGAVTPERSALLATTAAALIAIVATRHLGTRAPAHRTETNAADDHSLSRTSHRQFRVISKLEPRTATVSSAPSGEGPCSRITTRTGSSSPRIATDQPHGPRRHARANDRAAPSSPSRQG